LKNKPAEQSLSRNPERGKGATFRMFEDRGECNMMICRKELIRLYISLIIGALPLVIWKIGSTLSRDSLGLVLISLAALWLGLILISGSYNALDYELWSIGKIPNYYEKTLGIPLFLTISILIWIIWRDYKKADFYSYYGGSMGEYIQGYAAKRAVLFLLIIVLSVISYGIIGRISYQCMKHIQKIATDEGDMIVAQKAKWSWRRIKFDALCMAGIALFLLITGESRSTPVPNIILSIIFLIALLDILLRSMRLINKLNGIQEQTLKESRHPKKWDKVYCSVVVAGSLFGMIAAILGYSSMKDFTYRMVEEQEGDFITVGNIIFCYQGDKRL